MAVDLFAYPEFLIAAIAGTALLFSARATSLFAPAEVGSEVSSEDVNSSGIDIGLMRDNASSGMRMPAPLLHAGLSVFHFMPMTYRQWITNMLNWAGRRTNSAKGELAAVKLLFGLAPGLLIFVLPFYAFFAVPCLAALFYFLPDIRLVMTVAQRQKIIREALPQAIDLMVLCIDAGLGLDATVQRIAGDRSLITHALNDELSILGRDILLGMDRHRAYIELYKRTGVDELKMLASALHQSTKMGLSVGRILRAQAEFLRSRQSQRAEEKAAKLPVWISFPLWFCIMPALLFVIIGPALITFLKNIGHVKPEWFS